MISNGNYISSFFVLFNWFYTFRINFNKILCINKGSLEVGNDADLCVFDINKPWVVKQNELKSKSKNTPIENKKLQGQVLKTFVKGEIAYEKI